MYMIQMQTRLKPGRWCWLILCVFFIYMRILCTHQAHSGRTFSVRRGLHTTCTVPFCSLLSSPTATFVLVFLLLMLLYTGVDRALYYAVMYRVLSPFLPWNKKEKGFITCCHQVFISRQQVSNLVFYARSTLLADSKEVSNLVFYAQSTSLADCK